MKPYLYLSLMPESLVASHLAPAEFGAYLATGNQKRARGQALFFKLTDAYAEQFLKAKSLAPTLERPDGTSRRSDYLAVYRVLEQTPAEAFETLHLTTDDGRVLDLKPAPFRADPGPRYHLYQEFCPVTPRVVSELPPPDFAATITDTSKDVSMPAIVFAELRLNRLGDDPEAAGVDNLPYPNIEHLRDCLRELRSKPGKQTKTVIRYLQQDVLFRTLLNGFFVGKSGGGFLHFPMPPREELESTYYPWWRSALSSFGA
ncbi:MAG: hypothetical protein LBK99_05100 [Opitutaceae bacterium]|jgi:hypothetical protein|nr:hypothetical protein [Opitutaceae bacterium]